MFVDLGSALLSQDLKIAPFAECSQWHFVMKHSICSNPSFTPHCSKALNKKGWISVDLGNSYRQIVTDVVTGYFLWHFGIKAQTKCSSKTFSVHALSTHLTRGLTSEEITRHQWVVLVRICLHTLIDMSRTLILWRSCCLGSVALDYYCQWFTKCEWLSAVRSSRCHATKKISLPTILFLFVLQNFGANDNLRQLQC